MNDNRTLYTEVNESINEQVTTDEDCFDFHVFQREHLSMSGINETTSTLDNETDEAAFDLDNITITFDKNVSRADRLDYEISVCSGILTAAMDILFIKDFSLEEAHEWGREKTESFVKKVANCKTDYKGDDLAKAVEALEKEFPIPADELTNCFGGGRQHHLRDFSHHPTIMGLGFSIITQLTGYAFGTDVNGNLKVLEVSDKLIGKSFPEKIVKGTVDWMLHMVSDMAGSSGRIRMGREGTGLPGPVVSMLKEFSSLPIAKDFNTKYRDKEISLSQWTSKLFNGTLLAQHDENGNIVKGTEIRFDLRTEMGIGAHIIKTAVPVIVNECIVRAFYLFRHLFAETKRINAKSITDFTQINPASYLPVNSRELTRMITVSSGTFMLIVTAKDAAMATVKARGNGYKMAAYLILNINYFGILRFSFAVKSDASYIAEDIKDGYRDYVTEQKRKAIEHNKKIPGLYTLSLNDNQTRILYSLKYDKVLNDISSTDDEEHKAKKLAWLNSWHSIIIDRFQCDEFIITRYDELRDRINQEIELNGANWIRLVAIELESFKPYYLLSEKDNELEVKLESDYEEEIFCALQSEINTHELSNLRTTLSRYKDSLSGMSTKLMLGAGATVAAATLTGGLAFAFAPEIAVMLAGSSFASLSGAALTSASLAALGGGAITAGGLGMAGGTAVIAGGGTLLGVLGSGTVALSAVTALSSKERTFIECCKLLTYCRHSLRYDKESLKEVHTSVLNSIDTIENHIEELKNSKRKEDKIMLKNMSDSLKYIIKCEEQLNKLL